MTNVTDKLIVQSEIQGADQTAAGLQKVANQFEGLSVKSQAAEKSFGSIENRFASLERRYQTTVGLQQQYEAVQAKVNAAVSQNPALQERANAVLAAAAARYQIAGVAAKELATAHAGLDAQGQAALHSVRSVVEQLALGIPPTQALTGQLNHLTFAASGEGGLSGAFKQVAGLAGGLITPMRLVAGGALGLGAAALYIGNNWQESAGQIDRALTGIGQRTGETLQSINKFSSDNASATGLSVTQARNAALEFTKTGNIAISGLKGVGDAVHGFSILTGKDATDATKEFASALSGDLVKGAEKINETYGVLNSASMEYIRTLEAQGNRTAAIQVIVDAIAPANLRAADSVGVLSKAYAGLKNVVSNVFNGVPNSTSDQDKLAGLQQQRTAAASAPNLIGSNPGGYGLLNTGALAGGKAQQLADLDKQIDDVQKKIDAFNTGKAVAQLDAMSMAGDAVVKSIIPQIDQIHNLEAALNTLHAAQNTPGVSRSLGQDDSAATAIQNQIAALRDSQGEADRYNARVKEIGSSWGDVSQSTALSLQAAQNQLPVLEAVGGAAKMAAQAAADYANAMDQGKTATEAARLAASNLQARQAQVNSSALEQLASLRDQAAVAGARNVSESISAQAQATFNGLLRQGVDSEIAMAVAAQQEANARAQVFQQMQKAVRASQDQLDLTLAAGTGSEALVKSGIAWRNAMDAGATAGQAAQISTNVMMTDLVQAAKSADAITASLYEAAHAANIARANFNPEVMPSGSLSFSADPRLNVSYAGGGGGKRLDLGLTYRDVTPITPDSVAGSYAGGGDYAGAIKAVENMSSLAGRNGSPGVDVNAQMSQVDTLTQLLNSQTSDKGTQLTNLQSEMAWLNTLPETIARDQKIVSLQQSIDQLKNSTDANTAATAATLNPLYSQGHGALAIGYYKAASGLDVVAQGPSSGDTVPFHAMVNGGERITITPPGKSGNDNVQSTQIINNNNNFVFNNTSTNNARRSQRQFAQGFGQIAAAGS